MCTTKSACKTINSFNNCSHGVWLHKNVTHKLRFSESICFISAYVDVTTWCYLLFSLIKDLYSFSGCTVSKLVKIFLNDSWYTLERSIVSAYSFIFTFLKDYMFAISTHWINLQCQRLCIGYS